MRKTALIYDDSRIPDREIREITGNKRFGETIFKRRSLRQRAWETVRNLPGSPAFFDPDEVTAENTADRALVKLYSNMVIRDPEAFAVILEKAAYAKECYRVVVNDEIAAVIYPDTESYFQSGTADEDNYAKISSEAFIDLAHADSFRQFITGGFDARFFNKLSGDNYIVIKQSENVEKLRKEYRFYSLLPEEMRMWFAMPFAYREEGGSASYSMERYHMTDLAIRYVHGAISPVEFRSIMEKLFHFISTRSEKSVTADEYERCERALYVDKVKSRIEDLKKTAAFERIEALLRSGSKYESIDAVFDLYYRLYEKITHKKRFKPVLVVGHGDLCFSNILYNDEASFMKLIDPKGALNEEELYTNPYYDVAKLSHSVCGAYDFFNSDLFEIVVDEDMKLKLRLDADTAQYQAVFMEYLNRYKLDPQLIRLYEASLFLSMLPLHIDREKKVLGLLLNAIGILEGIEIE
ncbi:MAG: hypothetical protein IKN57_14245 [Parasporobacterium sp.]|nr:hypothetical protein [Parasporobacterium sp.]